VIRLTGVGGYALLAGRLTRENKRWLLKIEPSRVFPKRNLRWLKHVLYITDHVLQGKLSFIIAGKRRTAPCARSSDVASAAGRAHQ